MNAIQQFIQSKLSTAVRPETNTPTITKPQPSILDRIRGAGQTISDAFQASPVNQAVHGNFAPLGRTALNLAPMVMGGAVPEPTLPLSEGGGASDVPGLPQSSPLPKPATASPRIATMDQAAIRHIAETLKKTTPLGYIDYGELGGSIWSHINPKVEMPMSGRQATFGEMYRGVAKYLGIDPEEAPNVNFIKALADTFNRIHSGEHYQSPENSGGNNLPKYFPPGK